MNFTESLELTRWAEDTYDRCPECGEEYVGTDTTMSGKLVFVHQERPLESCTVEVDNEDTEA